MNSKYKRKAGYEFNKSACAKAIKARRIEKGYTQEDMANKVGVSRNSWQNTETSGAGLDSIPKVLKIASVLECDPYALMQGEVIDICKSTTFKTVSGNLRFLTMEESLNIGEELFHQMKRLNERFFF